jgi:hypothetical protein
MRADELGRRKPTTVFFDQALLTIKLRYLETINQKTSVGTQKSSNSPGKCYKPTYSINIQCCIIGHQLLLAKCVICFSSHGGRDMRHFYRIGLDIPTFFGLHKCD